MCAAWRMTPRSPGSHRATTARRPGPPGMAAPRPVRGRDVGAGWSSTTTASSQRWRRSSRCARCGPTPRDERRAARRAGVVEDKWAAHQDATTATRSASRSSPPRSRMTQPASASTCPHPRSGTPAPTTRWRLLNSPQRVGAEHAHLLAGRAAQSRPKPTASLGKTGPSHHRRGRGPIRLRLHASWRPQVSQVGSARTDRPGSYTIGCLR